MNVISLIFLAILCTMAALLCWSRAQALYLDPEGTAPRRVGALLLAAGLLSAGFADRTYHLGLPSAVISGIISSIAPDHGKYGFLLDHGNFGVESDSGTLVSLTAHANLSFLRPGRHVRVFYDPAAKVVRTLDSLNPNGTISYSFDNRDANQHQPNYWLWAAVLAALTALPPSKYPRSI